MAYRGWLTLNGAEIANTARLIAHLGQDIPVNDIGLWDNTSGPTGGTFPGGDVFPGGDLYPDGSTGGCGLVESTEHPGLYEIPATAAEVSPGLRTPPVGARRFGPGLMLVDGTCWGPASLCGSCTSLVDYDDSWPGLRDWLGDNLYRPELAPWYSTELPESGEFGGVWVTRIDGLGSTPVERPVTQVAGHGGVAGAHRDKTRTLTFEALMVACTHAGVEFGMDWLSCLLRDTTDNTNSTLRYLAASPAWSGTDPDSLVREVHGVVLTKELTVTDEYVTGGRAHEQANVYRVSWELTVLAPHSYLPRLTLPVDWDEITRQPVNWVHAADCGAPSTCADMPVLFSATCVPEEIDLLRTPPPVCGGCLPVGEIDKYSFRVPTMEQAFRCRETAVSVSIRNLGEAALSLQAFWRVCGTDVRCEDNRFPLQVAGLPPATELVLDGISGRFWAVYDGRKHRPVGVVGTPNGAPWRPPLIDRETCYEFVIQTASSSDFEVTMTLADREP
jgi:hypothetical protein